MGRAQTFQFKDRLIAVATLASLAGISVWFACPSPAKSQRAEQQRRTRTARSRTQPRSSDTRTSSSFSHEHHRLTKRKLDCLDCHNVDSRETRDAVVTAGKAIVSKAYPYHDKCLGCHRTTPPELFRGATPSICTVCHTRSSPRLTKTDLNAFPKQSAEMILGDLSIKFKHESTSHIRECTTCHLDVQRLDVDKADAPIATCASSSCHSKTGVQPAFQDQMLKMEDNDIVSGKNEHRCDGCHATTIAGKSPPCTHIKLFDPDGSFFTGAEFSKSAKLIAEKCK